MKVVDFTGTTKGGVEVDKVCDGAKECDEVIIVGWKDGDFYLASSNASIMDAVFLLRLAEKQIMDEL